MKGDLSELNTHLFYFRENSKLFVVGNKTILENI